MRQRAGGRARQAYSPKQALDEVGRFNNISQRIWLCAGYYATINHFTEKLRDDIIMALDFARQQGRAKEVF